MKQALILGAGRSAGALIQYMLEQAAKYDWSVVVADAELSNAVGKVGSHPNGKAIALDIANADLRRKQIAASDVVASMLPPKLHEWVAEDCLTLGKHLLTASYVSDKLYAMDADVRAKGLLFMGEIGLDPGIDHMSAMQQMDAIRAQGGQITGLRSYAGGLITPDSDTNPWHYKITWNPANVVRAGYGTAQYITNATYKYVPYVRLFSDFEEVDINGVGLCEIYPNRDSLKYQSLYGLEDVSELYRGTVRYQGFCAAWHALVKLGLTDDSYAVWKPKGMTFADWMAAYLPKQDSMQSLATRLAKFLGVETNGKIMQQLSWLGILDDEPIPAELETPADILQALMIKKWALQPNDRDRIIMQHEFYYTMDQQKHRLDATLVYDGENARDTAMSRLVGLPLGILMGMLMQGALPAIGVHRPLMQAVYDPVLEALKKYGVAFEDRAYAPSKL